MLTRYSPQNIVSSLSNIVSGNLRRTLLHSRWIVFWLMRYIGLWLPILLGIALSATLSSVIIDEEWHLALIIIFLVPAVILFLKYPFAAVIIWLLAAPFVQITPNPAYRALYWLIHRAMIPTALITVLMANQLKIKSNTRIKLGRIDLAILVSLGILLVSVILNYADPMPMFYNVFDRFIVPFCIYWLIRFTNPQEEDLRRLLPTVFFILVIETTIGLMSWFTPELLPEYWLKSHGARTNATFRAYSGFTVALMSYGLFLYYAAVNSKVTMTRLLYFVAFGFGCLGIFMSFSRGSWLSAVLVVTGLLFLYPKVTIRLLGVMSIVMVILAGTLLADQIAFANERLNTERTVLDRYVVYYTAWQMIQEKPFFGWGYETYDLYDRQFQERVENHVINYDLTSHNTFLTIFAERGTVGFFFYYFPLFWLLFMTLRVWSRMPHEGFWSRKLLIIFWLMLLFQIMVNNFTDTKRDPFIFTMWWLALAFITNMVESYLVPTDLGLPGWVYRALKKT